MHTRPRPADSTVTQAPGNSPYIGRHRGDGWAAGTATYPRPCRHNAPPEAACRYCHRREGYLVAVPELRYGMQLFEHPHCRPDTSMSGGDR